MVQMVKNLPGMREAQVWSLGPEHALEEEMVIHSSIVAWRTWGNLGQPGAEKSWDTTEQLTYTCAYTVAILWSFNEGKLWFLFWGRGDDMKLESHVKNYVYHVL